MVMCGVAVRQAGPDRACSQAVLTLQDGCQRVPATCGRQPDTSKQEVFCCPMPHSSFCLIAAGIPRSTPHARRAQSWS
jgi:hypothetical protein